MLAGTDTAKQTYNADGTIASTTLPAGGGLLEETVTYGYHSSGLVKTIGGSNTYLTDTVYEALGRPVEAVLSDGGALMVKNFVYDLPTGRLKRHLVWGDSAPDVLTDATYSYDAAGNITAVSDQLAQYGGVDDTQCFRYDYLRRMTEAWTPASDGYAANPSTATLGGPAPYWLGYTYDKTGNRKSETAHASGGDTVKSYAYPPAGSPRPHALTSVTTTGTGAGTVVYGYDQGGRTATRDLAAEDQTLTWDAEGYLDAVTSTATGNTDYIYSAGGDRLIRREPGKRTFYIAGQQIQTTNLGAVSGVRVYGEHAVRSTSTGLAWTASDHQGTGTITVDAGDLEGKVKRRKPFGETRGAAAPPASERGFVGGTDEPTGLVHMGSRDYDAGNGRFVSVDPVGDATDPQQMNGYAYANNTPVTLSDPSGRKYIDGETADTASDVISAPEWRSETPHGLKPGLGPKQNVYQAVIFDQQGSPIPVYVSITDACKGIMGPTICRNEQYWGYDVEFLGVAGECTLGGEYTMPCYLGLDGAARTLDGAFFKCVDPAMAGDSCLHGSVPVGPNPVVRVHLDLTGVKHFQERCPNISDVNIGPSTGIGYIPPEDKQICYDNGFDCNFLKATQWVDKWLGWLPHVGTITGGILGVDALNKGDLQGAAAQFIGVGGGQVIEGVVRSSMSGVGRNSLKYAGRSLVKPWGSASTRSIFGENAASNRLEPTFSGKMSGQVIMTGFDTPGG